MLLDLPIDVLKLILQLISLRDVARLLVAAASRSAQEILTQSLNNLQLYPWERYFNVAWVAKYSICVTEVFVDKKSMSAAMMRYLEDYGQWVTELTLDRDQDFETVSNIIDLLPNVSSLKTRSNDQDFHRFYHLFQSLPLRKFHCSYHRSTLEVLLDFPSLTEANLNAYYAARRVEDLGQHVFPHMTRFFANTIEFMDIGYTKHFPGLQSIIFKSEFTLECGMALADNCPQLTELDISIGASNGLAGLQYLLQRVTSIKKIELEASSSLDNITFQPSSYPNIDSVELAAFAMCFLPFVASCFPHVRNLDFVDSTNTKYCQEVSSYRYLKDLYMTMEDPQFDVLHRLLHRGHDTVERVTIKIFGTHGNNQDTCTAIDEIPIIPKLKYIGGLQQFYPTTYAILRQCPALRAIGIISGSTVDVKLLYEVCPHLTSISYSASDDCYPYAVMEHSHNKLQKITIGMYNKSSDMNINATHDVGASFPSLRVLQVIGQVYINSWTQMLASCSFQIATLIIDSRSSLDVVLDSLLNHSNFSKLKYVYCEKLSYETLQELTRASGGRIQFHNTVWLH